MADRVGRMVCTEVLTETLPKYFSRHIAYAVFYAMPMDWTHMQNVDVTRFLRCINGDRKRMVIRKG